MGRYDDHRETAEGWIARHELVERPSRSFRFFEPGKGSIYAYCLTWAPGSLTLSGDLGELVIIHYQAMPTFDEAIRWAAGSDLDYLLSKSSRKKVIHRERTVQGLIEAAIESQTVRKALEYAHFPIGKAWGAGLKRLLEREMPRAVQDLPDHGLPQFIYDLNVFDDWYGSYDWSTSDIHQITAVVCGCRMLLERLDTDKVAA